MIAPLLLSLLLNQETRDLLLFLACNYVTVQVIHTQLTPMLLQSHMNVLIMSLMTVLAQLPQVPPMWQRWPSLQQRNRNRRRLQVCREPPGWGWHSSCSRSSHGSQRRWGTLSSPSSGPLAAAGDTGESNLKSKGLVVVKSSTSLYWPEPSPDTKRQSAIMPRYQLCLSGSLAK